MAERYIPPAVVKGQGTPKREFGQKGQDKHSEVLPEAVLGPGARRVGAALHREPQGATLRGPGAPGCLQTGHRELHGGFRCYCCHLTRKVAAGLLRGVCMCVSISASDPGPCPAGGWGSVPAVTVLSFVPERAPLAPTSRALLEGT